MQPGDRGDAGVRQQLGKAADDLQKVNYAALSNDLKAQYDTAKRFITLGEQALREQNLIFAATLADKAGAIATLLLRRYDAARPALADWRSPLARPRVRSRFSLTNHRGFAPSRLS